MKIDKLDRATLIRMAQAKIESDPTVSGITIIVPPKKASGREQVIYIPKRSVPEARQ